MLTSFKIWHILSPAKRESKAKHFPKERKTSLAITCRDRFAFTNIFFEARKLPPCAIPLIKYVLSRIYSHAMHPNLIMDVRSG
jgi:hypothetical protein